MIVAIHRSGPSTAGTMRYNGDKVRAGVAEVVAEHGIGSTDLRDIARTLADRELLSLREAEHVSFQMSVNPGPDDRIRGEEIPAFIGDLMEGLGYGGQPWAVFRHEDTGRRHWHVVSVRVDADGRKINDYWEKRRCDRLVASLERKYRYTKGAGSSRKAAAAEPFPVFSKDSGDVVSSITDCVRHSLSYRFTTGRQFAEILRSHGVQVREGLGRNDLKPYLSFQGLDDNGRPCTGSVSGAKLPFDAGKELERRLAEGAEADVAGPKAALRDEMASVLKGSPDGESFASEMRRRGVVIAVYRDRDGTPRGTTVIDHRTLCAFKGTELSRGLSARMLSLFGKASTSGGDDPGTGVETGTEEAAGTRESSDFDNAVTTALSAAFLLLSGGGGGVMEEPEKKKKDKRKKRRTI